MTKKLISLILACCMLLSFTIPAFAWEAATTEADIRIGMFSDSHNNTGVINSVITAFNTVAPDLDGVVMAGDIVYMNGNTIDNTAYDGLLDMNSVKTMLDDDKLVFAMGNHEMPLHCTGDVTEEARTLFKEKTGLDSEMVTKLGGYTFITAGASNYDGDMFDREGWLVEQLETALADGTQKPVFLVLHHPVQNSVYESTRVGYSNEFKEYIEDQPRIIVVSGHVHQPINDPKTIKQIENGCTYVQTPHSGNGNAVSDSFATIPLSNTYDNMDSGALMMEIKDNVVTFNRMDIKSGNYTGEPWVIDIPKMIAGDKSAYKYTDARYEDSKVPVFKAGEATVDKITDAEAVVNFPAATLFAESDIDFAQYYRIKIIDEDVMLVKSNNVIMSDFFKATQKETVSQVISNLKASTNYRAEISAISPFFAESAPITVRFKTTEVAIDYGVELSCPAEPCAEGSTGGTVYGTTWATEGSGWRKYNFDITEAGVYRVSASLASDGCTANATVSQNDQSRKFEDLSVKTADFSTFDDYKWGTFALQPGTATVQISRAGGEKSLRIQSITLTKVGEITPGDIGYKVVKTLDEKDSYEGLGSATGSAGFSRDYGWITWKITPEYSGKYDISIKMGCIAPGDVSVYNATFENKSDENLIGSADVHIEDSVYGTTQYFKFGELVMAAGNEYIITMSYTRPAGAADTPYVSNTGCLMAEWTGDVSLSDLGYSIEKSVKDRTNAQFGADYGSILGLATSSHWCDWEITPEYTGVYDLQFKHGSKAAVAKAYIDDVQAGEEMYIENDVDWTANSEYRSFGKVTLQKGITYKVRFAHTGSGDSIALYGVKLIWEEEAAAEDLFIKEASFGQETRTDYKNGSPEANIGSSFAVPDSASAYVEHTITMTEGNYDLYVNYGCQNYAGVIGVYVNGEYCGKFDALVNNAWNTNQTKLKLTTVRLNEGKNVIKFTAPGGKYYCYTTFDLEAIENPTVVLYAGDAAEVGRETTEIIEGDMTARALMPRNAENDEIKMIFAIYKDNGELYKMGSAEVTGSAATAIAIPLEDIVFEDGVEYSYRVFFWDGVENLKPLY